ncbi:MAG: pyridoxamine 5'-phosphate oxidase family protein [Pseudomonadota bacterium]
MENAALEQVRQLIRAQRWAALATQRNDEPFASMVAYVPAADLSHILLHLSRLAPHTQNLLKNANASLVISEPDTGQGDPQLLARVSISGEIQAFLPEAEGYAEAKKRYIARLPDAERLFGFGDFMLLKLMPRKIRFVGGFAQAHGITPEELRAP